MRLRPPTGLASGCERPSAVASRGDQASNLAFMSTLAEARWSWTTDSFERAVAAGVFGPDARVELVEGDVLAVAAMLPGHARAVRSLRRAAYELDATLWAIGSQEPVRLSDLSEPEPDLWIARGGDDAFAHRHPSPADLVLVIEVSDTSLVLDREVKLPVYAASGVPEAWLVSIPERLVTSHRGAMQAERRYREVVTFAPGDVLTHSPTGLAVEVSSLFG